MARGRRLLLPASRAGGRRRLARHRAWPAWVAGAGPRLACHRPPAQKRGGPASRAPVRSLRSRCARRTRPRRQPSGEGGGTQEADKLLRFRSFRHRGRSLPRPAIPVPAAGIPPGREMRLTSGWRGAGAYHCPCISRVPAVYSRGPWPRNSRPAANLTAPAPGAPAHGQGRVAACQGQVTGRSTGGRRQVNGRSAGGRSGVGRRSAPGQWRLAAWASAPIRYP